MNNTIVKISTLRTWNYVYYRSDWKRLESFKEMGYGSIAIIPWFYPSGGYQKEGKKVIIHSGSMCRIIPFTQDYVKAGVKEI